jgi:hypothetical protein
MYFPESMEGWLLVCEYGAYFVYYHCVQMNLFENFLHYLHKSLLMKIYIGMEQVKIS